MDLPHVIEMGIKLNLEGADLLAFVRQQQDAAREEKKRQEEDAREEKKRQEEDAREEKEVQEDAAREERVA